jgi:hypothetical protein
MQVRPEVYSCSTCRPSPTCFPKKYVSFVFQPTGRTARRLTVYSGTTACIAPGMDHHQVSRTFDFTSSGSSVIMSCSCLGGSVSHSHYPSTCFWLCWSRSALCVTASAQHPDVYPFDVYCRHAWLRPNRLSNSRSQVEILAAGVQASMTCCSSPHRAQRYKQSLKRRCTLVGLLKFHVPPGLCPIGIHLMVPSQTFPCCHHEPRILANPGTMARHHHRAPLSS